MATKLYRTEDEVRDSAKLILGFDKKEDKKDKNQDKEDKKELCNRQNRRRCL